MNEIKWPPESEDAARKTLAKETLYGVWSKY